MAHDDLVETVAVDVCGKPPKVSPDECHRSIGRSRPLCREYEKCRILEKTEEQLNYVLSPSKNNLFLRACPGCGKTEVVGLKVAYEIQKWKKEFGGIAALSFTNNAAEVIRQRVHQFAGINKSSYPHFIGTIDSWLHGYIVHPFGYGITQYKGLNGDHSVRIIDSASSAAFLDKFKTKYSVNSTGNPSANQFYFDLETKRFVFASGDPQLDRARESKPLPDWLDQDLAVTKLKFMRNGFATYQDMETIGYRIVTENTIIAEDLSKRFPFIIIDECQDLSWIQLQILVKLKEQGTALHFIGDLNQAIFEFKKVDPQKVEDFIGANSFSELRLTSNHRSCQPIADVCQRIVKGDYVKGEHTTPVKNPCICMLYDPAKMSSLVSWFEEHLKELSIDIDKSAIITRSWQNVSRLRPSGHNSVSQYQTRLAMAIHLWRSKDIQAVEDSLKYLGHFLSHKYFQNRSSDARHYYCPDPVQSAMMWRIFLSRVLNLCVRNELISDLSQAWSKWVPRVRSEFGSLVKACLPVVESTMSEQIEPLEDLNGSNFRVPSGMADKPVEQSLMIGNTALSSIKITTIHSAKGQTYEAVLVVSSPNRQGTTDGHWTQWLQNPQSEAARLSYVASSRPRKLLAWAVSSSSETERKQLENLGFHIR